MPKPKKAAPRKMPVKGMPPKGMHKMPGGRMMKDADMRKPMKRKY